MTKPSPRLAVVLMNLGGPNNLDAVKPFLKNLFSDPAIIRIPWPFRPLLAALISHLRAEKAKKVYEKIGSSSPLLQNTQIQLNSLRHILQKKLPHHVVELFIAMRYWHPFTSDTVKEIKSFQPDEVVLLPLYPQFSTTTTGSSFAEWYKQSGQHKLSAAVHEIKCFPQENLFIDAHVNLLEPLIEKAKEYGPPRILFSAHGLPQKIIDAGDPYEKQIHETINAIVKKLPYSIDAVVCYQSKVGPLKWLGPSTEDELKRAGQDKVPVVVVPVAFVSEHVETLVELDHDYYVLSQKEGVPFYSRVPALGNHPLFIEALANLVLQTQNN